MDIRVLEYFVTTAEELNITKSAARLNMSQPPLSMQIKKLEEELQTVLFIRGGTHLELTESGKLLYRRAKEIISLNNNTKDEIIAMSQGITGTIAIGLVEGAALHIAAEWFAGFIREYPGVRFRIVDGNSDDLTERLNSGLISLAVITPPYDQLLLNGFMVGSGKIAVFMNHQHPLAKRRGNTLSIRDLKNENLIVPRRKSTLDMIYSWFQEVGEDPNIICETDSCLDAATLAEKGLGISLFPKTSLIPDDMLVSKELAGEDIKVEYLFAWCKERPLPLVEELFIEYVKKQPFKNTTEEG